MLLCPAAAHPLHVASMRPGTQTCLAEPAVLHAACCRSHDKLYLQSLLCMLVVWNHFVTGHGKHEADGEGTRAKKPVRDYQARPGSQPITEPSQMADFLTSVLSLGSSSRPAAALRQSAARPWSAALCTLLAATTLPCPAATVPPRPQHLLLQQPPSPALPPLPPASQAAAPRHQQAPQPMQATAALGCPWPGGCRQWGGQPPRASSTTVSRASAASTCF